jgi:hypothetical protein
MNPDDLKVWLKLYTISLSPGMFGTRYEGKYAEHCTAERAAKWADAMMVEFKKRATDGLPQSTGERPQSADQPLEYRGRQ